MDEPFYCNSCLYGKYSHSNDNALPVNLTNNDNINANTLCSGDMSDLCPNSVFNDKESIITSDYYTINRCVHTEAKTSL